MAERLPTFLIVGAMRSGTTFLSRYVGSHPDVFLAPEKEVHYFDRFYGNGPQWYAGRFRKAGSESQIGEATPIYIYHPAVPPRMRELLPDARLVAVLRNPVDRAYSHYWHSRSRGRESLSFSDAIDAEPLRLERGGRDMADHSYIDRGRYVDQLERLCEYYPTERLLVLKFEDLRSDPLAAFRRTCEFIGVDAALTLGSPKISPNTYRIIRSPWLRAHTRNLPRPIRNVVWRLNSVKARYPPMDSGLCRELEDRFAPYNEKLAQWLGLDAPIWP